MDTLGNLHETVTHNANIADCAGGILVMKKVEERKERGDYPRLALVMGDHAFGNGGFPSWVEEHLECAIDISTKSPTQRQFIPYPIRWVVEQTISCLARNRRLSKDYEYVNESSEAMLYIASISRSLRRLTCNESH